MPGGKFTECTNYEGHLPAAELQLLLISHYKQSPSITIILVVTSSQRFIKAGRTLGAFGLFNLQHTIKCPL